MMKTGENSEGEKEKLVQTVPALDSAASVC